MPFEDNSKLAKMFPACTEVGLYPVIYVNKGEVLCALCARELFLEERVKAERRISWEGPSVECDNCGEILETAYGEPEENTKEEN